MQRDLVLTMLTWVEPQVRVQRGLPLLFYPQVRLVPVVVAEPRLSVGLDFLGSVVQEPR